MVNLAKHKKTIVLFNLLITSCSHVSSAEDACQVLFSTARAEIHYKINSDRSLFLKHYKGQKGYLRFTEELNKSESMRYVFAVASEMLSAKERKGLDWQVFQGTTIEFKSLKPKILDQKENIKTKYLGREGYILFADKYYEGIMLRAYINTSAVLDIKQKTERGWQAFHGTTKEFKELIRSILDSNGNIKTEFLGMEGYARFADRYYKGNMLRTFLNISAVLGKQKMKELGWRQFQKTTKDYKDLKYEIFKDEIVDEEGKIKPKFLGVSGYVLFSDYAYNGNMNKAYANISTFLDKQKMQELEWQGFNGTTKEFRELRNKILDQKGHLKPKYLGMDGYVYLADRYYRGAMKKTYLNVSAVLDKRKMKESGWRQFQGTTKEFKALRNKILDQKKHIKPEYLGMDGFAQFADTFYGGNMHKTYINISVVLDKKTKQQLNWQFFYGTTKEFRELRNKILDSEGSIRAEFYGMQGYAQFAEKHFEGNMLKAYMNVSAVLDKKPKHSLNWKVFRGTTKEFRELRNKILDSEGSIRAEFYGMQGYAQFAKKHFEGNMSKTYANISTVLGGVLTIRQLELGWKQFQGSVNQFYALKGLFEKYDIESLKGEKGQKLTAQEIFNGDIQLAYYNVSTLREELLDDPKDFPKLGWLRASEL